MKITGLSHLFKWEIFHNWWLTKYFFAPLYMYMCVYIYIYMHTYIHTYTYIQWGKKVFSQPPIVQVIPLGGIPLITRQVEFLPKSSILVSSDHMAFSQSSSGSSKCSLANFRRAWTCTGLSRGTRLALQDLSPWRRSVLLMVAFVTIWSQLSAGHSLGPPVWFWDFCSQFL